MIDNQENLGASFWEKTLNAAQDGIFVYDLDSSVLFANDAACALCGIPPEMLKKRRWKWQELVDKNFFYEGSAPYALRNGKRHTTEFTNHLGYHLLSTATPILDEEGKPYLVITNLRDITLLSNLQKELQAERAQLQNLQNELAKQHTREEQSFIYASPKMKHVIELLDRVAFTDMPVLLLGESGVGKSELAVRIHEKSPRNEQKLVVVNCGAIPPSLCEAEFFGYEKGAFTGANFSRKGVFEEANNSTLLLDEIGELPLMMQPKLLRVLQEGKMKRLGSQTEISVNVRLVSATNQDLLQKVREGTFREDLYHRINTVTLSIPPLRECSADIKRMLSYFLHRFNSKYNVHKTMSPELVARLEAYSWPGNTREMEHLLEKLVVLSMGSEMGCEYLSEELQSEPLSSPLTTLSEACEKAEKDLLTRALKQLKSTRKIAKALNVSHVTISRKLRQYGLAVPS